MNRFPISRARPVFTIADAVDEVLLAFGIDSAGDHLTWAKMAVRSALSIFPGERCWSYWLRNGAVTTVEPQTTGTVAYTASTSTLTLTGATWPSDMLYRRVQIGTVAYQVEKVLTTTTLVLKDGPAENVASGASYKAVRVEYPVPENARRITALRSPSGTCDVAYVSPQDVLELRTRNESPGLPEWYTLRGDSVRYGQMAFEFGPAPNSSKRYEYLYYASPGEQSFQQYGKRVQQDTGLVSWSAAGTTITNGDAVFASSMIGSVIRFSEDNSPPTGRYGDNPFTTERIVTAVGSTTTLTVDSAIAAAGTNVGYSVSDPLDIAPELWEAFMRCAELEFGKRTRDVKELGARPSAYRVELARAFAADQTWTPPDVGTWSWIPLENLSFPR